MYQINSNGQAYYADDIRPVTLADNGCYIFDREDKGGIVAKVFTLTTDEDGVERYTSTDMVFRTKGDALHGTEPLCTYEQFWGAVALNDYTTALQMLGIETEEQT